VPSATLERARIVENFALAGAVERHVQLYASLASLPD